MKRLHENHGTILIVDDTPANLSVMVDMLEHYGHRVVVAQDGGEGLLRASIVRPDIILLDVMMPGIDGFEVCRRLKAMPETHDIPVIFMTALSDAADKITGFTAGGTDYITKPFHIEEALARIGTHLKLRAAQRQLESQNGELQRYRESLEQQVVARTAELRESNERLDASERAFRTLAENSPDYIARYDSECRRMYLNPAVLEVSRALGNGPPEGAPQRSSLVDTPRYVEMLRQVLNTGEPCAEEIRFVDAAGRTRWGHMRVVPEFGPDGKVTSAVAVCRDIHELKESEQRFRTLAENLPDIVMRYDMQGRKVYINSAAGRQLGIDPETMIGQTPEESGTVIQVTEYSRALRRTLDTGEPQELEIESRHPTDGTRAHDVRFCAERDEQGRIVGALMVARDITERQQMEASIAQERATLRAFFRALPDLAWMKDAEGRYLACNPLFERFFGAPEAEIVGRTDFDFVDAELAAFFRRKDKEAEAAGGPTANEEWITFADDGRRALLETVKAPVTDAHGRVIGVIGVGHDITERAAMEGKLRESELRFRTLAESSPNIIMRYDRDCRSIYVNPAYERETELPRERVIDSMPGKVWRPDVSVPIDRYLAQLREVMETRRPAEMPICWTKQSSGELVHHALHIVPEYDESGAVKGVLTIGHDITALVEAERRLRESFDLLQELTTRRETAREEERKRIAREIHDELGQHLTALRMGVSTLRFQFGKDNPLLAERVQDMMALADKTIQVVRDVAAALRPAVLDTGLGPALEWTAAQFEQHSGIPCRVNVPDDCPGIDEDRAMAIFRIVQESLTNVARHARAKWVQVDLKRKDGHYLVRICDGGQGFVPNGDRSKTFGLVGMRERALMFGGEIDIASRPGEGTIVAARIPVRASQEAS